MKLYVSSVTDIVNEERAQSILKEVGIIKKIDGFSDCLNSCHCKDFKEGLEIRFDILKRFNTRKRRIDRLLFWINPFKKSPCDTFSSLLSIKPTGFFDNGEKRKTIFLFLDQIIINANKSNLVLKHELLHFFGKPHCSKNFCNFYGNKKDEVNEFCEECQKEYNKILEEINK